MPVSERKRLANQRNAAKSTGPKTVEGKRRSSRNAMFHGLFAQDDVLPGECEPAYGALRDELLLSMMPQNALEMSLAERVVSATWRIRRIQSAQSGLYARRVNQLYHAMCSPNRDEELSKNKLKQLIAAKRPVAEQLPAATVLAAMAIDDEGALDRLMMYEHRLDQTIHRCLRQLRELQNPKHPRPANSTYLAQLQAVCAAQDELEAQEQEEAAAQDEDAAQAEEQAEEITAVENEPTEAAADAAARVEDEVNGDEAEEIDDEEIDDEIEDEIEDHEQDHRSKMYCDAWEAAVEAQEELKKHENEPTERWPVTPPRNAPRSRQQRY